MPDEETTVEGLSEIADALERLPLRVARNVARPSLNAAGQVFKAALHATVPKGETGELDASIGSRVHVSNNLEDMSIIAGPRYMGGHKFTSTDPGVRGKFLELGTRKMAPRFWMRKAFEMSKKTAADAAITVMRALMNQLPK